MKNFFLRFLSVMMWIVSKIYPYRLSQRIRAYRDVLYTMWVQSFIGHIGNNVTIVYSSTFNGGGFDSVEIGDGTIIYKNCIIESWRRYIQQEFTPSLKIGKNCRIGEFTHITTIHRVIIGDNLLTGRFVIITDHSHGKNLTESELDVPPALRTLYSKGEVVIGNNVWIGDKVSILPNSHIGNNVIIGSNAVVTGDFPDNCVIAGIPAKIVKRIEV